MTHTGGLNPLSLLCMADVGGDGARRTGGMKGAAAAAAAATTTVTAVAVVGVHATVAVKRDISPATAPATTTAVAGRMG